MRYDMSEQTQWYATLSRSVEPAHAWSMLWGSDHYFADGNGPATGRQEAARRLKTQIAHSFEVGGHGQHALGEWSISYYYSQLENELLMVQLQPNPHPVIAESNASATIHQGLEIALNTSLWESETAGLVSLKQAYTLSDFYYQNDPLFQNNQLAGLPRHYYQAHLKYQHPKGWWLGLNTEYASAITIDYANTHQTDAYQIWGIQAAWPSIWSNVDLWLEAKNLTQQNIARRSPQDLMIWGKIMLVLHLVRQEPSIQESITDFKHEHIFIQRIDQIRAVLNVTALNILL